MKNLILKRDELIKRIQNLCRKEVTKSEIKIILERILLISVFITFVLISVIMGKYHEPWSDEAQSYLIARDNSIIGIFQATRYEGAPVLWYLILKIVILTGFNYQYIWAIPMAFTILGVFLLLFKTDLPIIVKVLFPFTYYLLYQYNVVNRAYCTILPMLILISTIFDKKLDKSILFAIYLIIFLSISSHTFFIAGIIYLMYLIELVQNLKSMDESLKRKNIISAILIFLAFLITVIYVFPTREVTYPKKTSNPCVAIANAFYSKNTQMNWKDTILTIGFMFIILVKYEWKKYNLLITTMFAPIVMISFFHTETWHYGIILLSFIFVCIITNRLNKDKLLLLIFCIICLIQINWAKETWRLEYTYMSSPSREIIADLIKNQYEEKKIYGVDYSVIAINPYFEKNIFSNLRNDKGYYLWSKNNNYMTEEEMINDPAEIYIIHTHGPTEENDIWRFLNSGDYERKDYLGLLFAKGEPYLSNYMSVFVKK